MLVNVEFRRHTRFSQGHVERHAVFSRNSPIVIGKKKKSWRRLSADLFFIGEIVRQLGIGVIAQQAPARTLVLEPLAACDHRISQDGKVRP